MKESILGIVGGLNYRKGLVFAFGNDLSPYLYDVVLGAWVQGVPTPKICRTISFCDVFRVCGLLFHLLWGPGNV